MTQRLDEDTPGLPPKSIPDLGGGFQLLMDGVKDYAIIVTDPGGNIVDWNTGAELIFGYPKSEVLHQPAQLIFTAEDRRNNVPETEMRMAVANGQADDERWHLRKNDSRFMASGVLTAVRDRNGELRGFVKILRDITDRKKAEQLHQRALRHEDIATLAGGAAHDFNNLLTSILGNASLALDYLSESSPLQELLQEVVTASNRAAVLTRQLLAYAGRGNLVSRSFSVSSAVEAARKSLENLIPKQVPVEFDLAPDLPQSQGDPNQIEHVVVNLVTNAAEATAGRNGSVRVVTRLTHLQQSDINSLGVEGVGPGPFVCLDVTDTGVGMDEGTVARMFDPFFTTKFVGRGLGLAAVSGIVRQHRGAIRVQSELDCGTTVQVYLPARASESGARREAPPTGPLGGLS